VLVKWEVGADKGEAASDHGLKWRVGRVGDAEVLGHALGFVVGALKKKRVGSAEVSFRGVEQGGRAAVDGTRRGIEQAGGAGGLGELEDAAGAFEDGLGQLVGGAHGLDAAGVRGGVEDVGVFFFWELERSDVAFEQGDDWICGDVW